MWGQRFLVQAYRQTKVGTCFYISDFWFRVWVEGLGTSSGFSRLVLRDQGLRSLVTLLYHDRFPRKKAFWGYFRTTQQIPRTPRRPRPKPSKAQPLGWMEGLARLRAGNTPQPLDPILLKTWVFCQAPPCRKTLDYPKSLQASNLTNPKLQALQAFPAGR